MFLAIVMLISNCFLAQNKDTIILNKNQAQKAIFICKWGDPKRMELHSNGKIYQFKRGLEDGMYIAYYDKNLRKDTAMVVVMQKGKVDGLMQRWDLYDHLLSEECEYKNGLMDGYRKLYFRSPEGEKLTNIERWEKGIHQEDILLEW